MPDLRFSYEPHANGSGRLSAMLDDLPLYEGVVSLGNPNARRAFADAVVQASDGRASLGTVLQALATLALDFKKTETEPVLIRMSDVKPEPIRWLWPGRIALGKLTLFAGDPGLGKSFLSLDMAARISKGRPWPDMRETPNPAGGVVLLTAEDDLGDTVRPRLDAALADTDRIIALRSVLRRNKDGTTHPESFSLTCDVDALEQAIRSLGDCRLVIIDPISAYMGSTDSHMNTEVRAVMAPISELASRAGVAVVAITHLRKGEGAAIYRAMGSLGFVAAARAAWAVTKDREDEEGHRRLFLPIKNNIAPDQSGLAFRLEPADNEGTTAYVSWFDEPVLVKADDAVRQDRKPGPEPRERSEAEGWLRGILSAGPVLTSAVFREAQAAGHSTRTVHRAAENMRVDRRKDGANGSWSWRLAEDDA